MQPAPFSSAAINLPALSLHAARRTCAACGVARDLVPTTTLSALRDDHTVGSQRPCPLPGFARVAQQQHAVRTPPTSRDMTWNRLLPPPVDARWPHRSARAPQPHARNAHRRRRRLRWPRCDVAAGLARDAELVASPPNDAARVVPATSRASSRTTPRSRRHPRS